MRAHTYLKSGAEASGDCFQGLAPRIIPIEERRVSIIPPRTTAYYDDQEPDLVYNLIPKGMRRVLDVGCGTGKLGARLKSEGVTEVIGIEVSEDAAAEARVRLDQVYVADIEEVDLLCPDGYFDCIVYSGVLEHLRDPWHVLSRHRRVLSDDGCIVCLLPNVQHHTVIENLLQGFWTYQPEGQLDATHYRFFTAFEIARMLSATGFVTQEFRGHKLGERSERFEQLIRALKPLGLLSKDFEHLTDCYIFLLRAGKAAGWDLVSPGAPTTRGGLAQDQNGRGHFTGERAIPLAPNMDQEVMREHWARYRFALAKVEGKRVLDAACGTGYGSRLLAEKASFVKGVDVSPDAVLYAGQHYGSPNVAFSAMDIRSLALAGRSFDVVVSFETLEHIREADAFLSEVCRVLNNNGEFIVSTPLGGPVGNPFHLAYYQRDSFGPLLQRYFDDVTLYYQRGSDFFVTPVSPLSAPTFTGEYAIAICSGPRHGACGDETPQGRNAQAERLILEGRLDEATRELHEALRLRPDYSAAYNNLGTIAFARGRHAEAEELFSTAVGLNPDDDAARDNLSDLVRLMKESPLVSIVILTYNELPYTRLCVESIEKFTPERHELVFVDNGSSDGTLDYIGTLPSAVIVANESNRGFAAGCNQGIARARGRYVLLLNNDVVVTEGWLTRMLRWFETDPRLGIVGPMTNYVVGPQRVQPVSYGADMPEMQAFARRFGEANAGKSFVTARAVGFCLLMKRDVVEKIGGLDDRFRTGNFEDDDFCLRAAIAGYKLLIAQDVFVHHFGGRTFAGAKIDYRASIEENWRRFKLKWGLPSGLDVRQGYPTEHLLKHRFSHCRHFISLPSEGEDSHRGGDGERQEAGSG